MLSVGSSDRDCPPNQFIIHVYTSLPEQLQQNLQRQKILFLSSIWLDSETSSVTGSLLKGLTELTIKEMQNKILLLLTNLQTMSFLTALFLLSHSLFPKASKSLTFHQRSSPLRQKPCKNSISLWCKTEGRRERVERHWRRFESFCCNQLQQPPSLVGIPRDELNVYLRAFIELYRGSQFSQSGELVTGH